MHLVQIQLSLFSLLIVIYWQLVVYPDLQKSKLRLETIVTCWWFFRVKRIADIFLSSSIFLTLVTYFSIKYVRVLCLKSVIQNWNFLLEISFATYIDLYDVNSHHLVKESFFISTGLCLNHAYIYTAKLPYVISSSWCHNAHFTHNDYSQTIESTNLVQYGA